MNRLLGFRIGRTLSNTGYLADKSRGNNRSQRPKFRKEEDVKKDNVLSKAEALAMLNALNEIQGDAMNFDSLMDMKTKKEKDSNTILKQLRIKLLTGRIEPASLFNKKEVEKSRKSLKRLVPELEEFNKKAYLDFKMECFDDGYNKQYKNWLLNAHPKLPTTNEEGQRHKDLDGHWSEHVFFHKYVDVFPEGRIKTFMNAVSCGLSQNPFLSVDEKKEHLEFFRQYFSQIHEDLVNNYLIKKDTLPNIPFIEKDENGKWPSEKEIMKKYSEMNPFEKEWYAEQFGPMSHRVKRRRSRLAALDESDAETGNIKLDDASDT